MFTFGIAVAVCHWRGEVCQFSEKGDEFNGGDGLDRALFSMYQRSSCSFFIKYNPSEMYTECKNVVLINKLYTYINLSNCENL